MVSHAQSSPGFDRCFVIYAKNKENNMVYTTHVGACTLLNVVYWFIYQNGSGKKISFFY